MKEQIQQLEKVARLLDPSNNQRSQWNQEVLRYAETFIDGLDVNKAYYHSDENENPFSDSNISEEPTELSTVLNETHEHIDQTGINPASGGHMGYIPGGGLYPSALGDFIAAVNNRYAGVFYAAPGAVKLENNLIRWMCDLIGYAEQATGNLTSGGSIANLIAVVTAREARQIKSKNIEKLVIYLSKQAHHSIEKAFRIAGLAEAHLRYIPLDDGLRLSVDHLENVIIEDKRKGLVPFFVNASFGTTNTGAIDPLAPIAQLARQHGMWFHVDAAYGGFFKLVDRLKEKFAGIEKADSITLDPHKTLFLPFGTGTILIKDRQKVLQAHHYLADYMQDTINSDSEISPADVSPELTKHFRGMRLWLPLKLFGLRPFRAALEEKLLLARYFHQEISKIKGFETGPLPELSVALFRFIPTNEEANSFNKRLIEAIQKDGRIFLSSTTIDGIFWIRVAIVIFRTHLEQIDLLLNILKQKVVEIRE